MFPRRIWEEMLVSKLFDAEPRGWWFEEVAPRYGVTVAVSEVASPCRSGRDVYLRRVVGLRLEGGGALTVGRLVHEAFMLPFRLGSYEEARRELVEALQRLGLSDEGMKVYLRVLEEGFVRYKVSVEEAVPVLVEPKIPGQQLGLATVKPDLLVGYTPVEIVVASNGGSWIWRKRLAVAGYALAVEAWFRSPVDYGVVLGVKIKGNDVEFDWRLVKIDSALRRQFLERRDMVASIIASGEDPGVAESCPRSCPFWGVCHDKASGS